MLKTFHEVTMHGVVRKLLASQQQGGTKDIGLTQHKPISKDHDAS